MMYDNKFIATLNAVKTQVGYMQADIRVWKQGGCRRTDDLVAQLDARVRFIEARLAILEDFKGEVEK